MSNSSPLGGVQGHDADLVVAGVVLGVHHQRDVFEEARQVLELLHGAHQLLEVLQAAGGVGALVVLPHLGVAGLVEHDLGQLGVRHLVLLRAPAVEVVDHGAERIAGLGLQLVGSRDRAGRLEQRDAALARVVVQELDGGVAEPAFGHVDDALEGEVVADLMHHAEIGQRVADFGALVEPRTADHAIGQAERDEAVFQLAHLVGGANQNGDLVEDVAGALQRLDLLADAARFFLGVPRAGDGDLLAGHVLGAQGFAESALVVRDQVRGGGEDMSRAAVIPLQPDHLGARKIVVEAQDVVDLRPAPAVDRLVVVADAADVFGLTLLRRLALRDARALPSLLRVRDRVGRPGARKLAARPNLDPHPGR